MNEVREGSVPAFSSRRHDNGEHDATRRDNYSLRALRARRARFGFSHLKAHVASNDDDIAIDPQKTAADVEFVNVGKQYPNGPDAAIRDLSLYVPAGTICCLIGPSGCGKTTALKMINRLIEPTAGDILIGGKSVLSLPATQLRRDVGYVFQQVGLLPHLTVSRNIGLTPRLLGWKRERIAARVREPLELIRLPSEIANRYPAHLPADSSSASGSRGRSRPIPR